MKKTLQFPETTYVGETKNGLPHGKGILTFHNGGRYEGDFFEAYFMVKAPFLEK